MDKVAIISTVKAPIEELKMFIFHHKRIGVGEIIFFIDDYDGSDLSEIEQLGNVTLVKCDSEYWEELGVDRPISIESRQVMNVNRGAALAQSFGCKWLVHIDNDELLIVKNDIKAVFSCIDDSVDAVRFDMFEAVPDKINHCNIYEPRLFKVRSTRLQIFLAKLFGCRRAILDNEYFRAHSI